MCMKPDIIAERFVRINGLLSALETVARANADQESRNFSGVFVLISEVESASHELKKELMACAQQQQAST
jgi:hypothetical protein